MNLLKFIGQVLLFYILYRIIVNFVIPAFRGIRKFRQQFTQMQQNMQQQFEKAQTTKETPPQPEKKNVSEEKGEYIDFEEIKN